MGWDTQINILAENCKDDYLKIARLIYEKDAKGYIGSGYLKICFRKNENSTILFFSYERRKYLPYWIIQEISTIYRDVSFTVVASCPEFIGGPAGIVKIISGEIIDSYGFFGLRQSITQNPDAEMMFQWFGKNKKEEIIREGYTQDHPHFWCEENYVDNLIEFTEAQTEELEKLKRSIENNVYGGGWSDVLVK